MIQKMHVPERLQRLGATIALVVTLALVAIVVVFVLQIGRVFREARQVSPAEPAPAFLGPTGEPFVRGPGGPPPGTQ